MEPLRPPSMYQRLIRLAIKIMLSLQPARSVNSGQRVALIDSQRSRFNQIRAEQGRALKSRESTLLTMVRYAFTLYPIVNMSHEWIDVCLLIYMRRTMVPSPLWSLFQTEIVWKIIVILWL